ncbi:Catalase-like domain, heme-dependent [Metarhizium album ARSEF 1941]|uniref:Catalase-like domain, heme-dependent n=1 Tax=Metarhizium album (strain ARSEF 1941) TaxID=1081103 RepID=A0A0B2WN55_METAS|nr:Catalase-like domain, heme-dependent [Metarhizium album ARSEF 1941]KHN97496.1 Catalase-like domain, heme-dependent [Metarhizium album ARSEF 1941]
MALDVPSAETNGSHNSACEDNRGPQSCPGLNHGLLDKLAQFNREKIPERAVTHDISDICDIDMLLGVGKKTPCVVRFSTTALERGSAEAVRDVKGLAVKLFTREGNWDWVCLNIPMFFIRDPAKFPDLIRAQRPDPQTNLANPSRWWEFVCDNDETLHMVMFQFSDFGTMFDYRSMSGYVGHAYKWVKPDGSWKYVHWFLSSDQGPNFEQGSQARAVEPDDQESATRDLHESLGRGECPSWTASVQVIDPEDARGLSFNILDVTKHWNLGNYPPDIPVIPSRPFGKLTLRKGPRDYFREIEQLAFSPSHLVPGVEPSEDPMLQARLFAYPDAQRYRLGPQNLEMPANKARRAADDVDAPTAASRDAVRPEQKSQQHSAWVAETTSSDWSKPNELDYKFPREFWKALPVLRSDEFQNNLVVNISESVSRTPRDLRLKVYRTLGLIASDMAERVEKMTEELVVEAEKKARL